MSLSNFGTLFCLMALVPSLVMSKRCMGGGKKLNKDRTYGLKLAWNKKTTCIDVRTEPDYTFVMDCSPVRSYFVTGDNGCDKNRFVFYPAGNADTNGVTYCGEFDGLRLESDGPHFYAKWINKRRFSDYNEIFCKLVLKKNESSTNPAVTTKKPVPTTAKPGLTTQKPVPNTPKPSTCDCGKHNTGVSRIVNGQETKSNEYPFYAGLYLDDDQLPFCGGSLISEKWILTAAHCMSDPASRISVVLGSHDLTISEPTRRRYMVEKYINHESYSPNTFDNDVALVKLKASVEMTDDISVACLAPNGFTQQSYNNYGTVMGYGNTKYQGQQPTVLLDVKLRIMSAPQCEKLQSEMRGEVTDNMICAYQYGKDSCQGDSGGPLVFEKDDRLVQVGIVSHGVDCAVPKYPGVYSKVENFVDWIRKKTRNTFCGV